ncbi:hypothetical protein Vretimale_2099 [Volvox reticuliferus]|uniref:Nucleoprotein TPR/MLP1 domain-containing protein n=1 Tax=Volvox reticuliferus TaxID=1737510 RepID=A0A8J4C5E9_9CHLO|nr:hypothetical protein Vretifemale_4293 [Volvox reticuliferus]GIL96235.1 hypothetical protein Vretimale_2099 [Volvox reticuliferus]
MADMERRVADLEQALQAANAQMEANEMSYSLALKHYQQNEEHWSIERKQLQEKIDKLGADLEQRSQGQEELARVAQELRGKQRALDELQGALSVVTEQRSNMTKTLDSLRTVLVAKDEEVAVLAKQKADLADLVHQMQTSLSSNDNTRQLALLQTQYDQDRRFWESKLKLLEDELNAKNNALLEDKRRASGEQLALRQKVAELEYSNQVSVSARMQLEAQLRELDGFLRDARKQAHDLEQAKIDLEEHWRRQAAEYQHLTMQHQAARMAAEEEASALRAQLAELQGQLQVLQSISDEAANKVDALQSAYGSAAQRHKAQVQHLHAIIAAAMSSGDVTILTNAMPPGSPEAAAHGAAVAGGTGAAIDPVTPGPQLVANTAGTTPGSTLVAAGETMLQGKTVMEVWAMYQEMQDAWHQERAEARKMRSFMETIAADLEAKMAFSARQQEAADKMREALDQSMATVATLEESNQRLQESLSTAQGSLERKESEKRSQEQTIRDLTQQVKVLMEEVQRLSGKPIARTSSGSMGSAGGSTAGNRVTADQLLSATDVINHRLVTFRTLDELVEQNRRLLTMVRQLGAENERSREEVARDMAHQSAAREQEDKSTIAVLQRLTAELTGAAHVSTKRINELTARTVELEEALVAAKAAARGTSTNSTGGGSGGNAPVSRGDTLPPPGDVAGAADDGAAAPASADLARAREDLSQTRQEMKSLADTMQAQVNELREKLAAAASESARHAGRAEDWRQRCTTLESLRESELAMRNALAAEKAQLGALLATAQHKADVAQQSVEELQAQLRTRTEHQVVLEARMSAQTTALEEARSALAMAETERTRALADAKVAEQLRANSEATARMQKDDLQRQVAGLQSDMARLKEDHERQQTIFHHSVEAATAQLREVRDEASNMRRARDEAERSLVEARDQVVELRGRIAELQAQVSDLTSQLSAVRGGGTALADLVEGQKLRDVEAQLRETQADLASAREQLEARNASLETLRGAMATLQGTYDALRESHEAAQTAALQQAEEAEAARVDAQAALAAAEAAIGESRAALAALQVQHEALQASSAAEAARLSTEVERLGRELADRVSQRTRADEDIARLQAAVREYRSRYEEAVGSHARDVSALQTAETRLEEAQATVNRLQNDLMAALNGVDERLATADREKEALKAELATAEARLAERIAANEQLLTSVRGVLAGTHHELVGMSAEQYKSLMDYLGRDKALATAQLELLASERNKLRGERDSAVQQAAVLRAQMASLQDSLTTSRADLQARINLLEAEDHARRLAQGQLRGELDTARGESERFRTLLAEAEQRAGAAEASLRESAAGVAGLQAQLEAHKRGETLWREKYDALMTRYGKVTLEEHNTVKAELATARAELASASEQVKGLQTSGAMQQQQLDELRTAKDDTAADLEKSRKEFADLRGRHNMLVRKHRELTAANEATGKELAAAREQLATANDKTTALEAQLAKAKEDTAASVAEATGKIKASNKQAIERIRTLMAEKNTLEGELQTARTSLEALNKTLEEERMRRANDGRAAAMRVLDVERQLKAAREELAASQGKVRELTERIERARARRVGAPIGAAGPGVPSVTPTVVAPAGPPTALSPVQPPPTVAPSEPLASAALLAAAAAAARGARRTPIQFPTPATVQQPTTQRSTTANEQAGSGAAALPVAAAACVAAAQQSSSLPAAQHSPSQPAAAVSPAGAAAQSMDAAPVTAVEQLTSLPNLNAVGGPGATGASILASPAPVVAADGNDVSMAEACQHPAVVTEPVQPLPMPPFPFLPPQQVRLVGTTTAAIPAETITTGSQLAAPGAVPADIAVNAIDTQQPTHAGAAQTDAEMGDAAAEPAVAVVAAACASSAAAVTHAAVAPTATPAEPLGQPATAAAIPATAEEKGLDNPSDIAAQEQQDGGETAGDGQQGNIEEGTEEGSEEGEDAGVEQIVVAGEGPSDGAMEQGEIGDEAGVAARGSAEAGQDAPEEGELQEDQDLGGEGIVEDDREEQVTTNTATAEVGADTLPAEAQNAEEAPPGTGQEEQEDDGDVGGDVISGDGAEVEVEEEDGGGTPAAPGEPVGGEAGTPCPIPAATGTISAAMADMNAAEAATEVAGAAQGAAKAALEDVTAMEDSAAQVQDQAGVEAAGMGEEDGGMPEQTVALPAGGDMDAHHGGENADGDSEGDGDGDGEGEGEGEEGDGGAEDYEDGSSGSSGMDDDDEDPDLKALRLKAIAAATTNTRKRQMTPMLEDRGGGDASTAEAVGMNQSAAPGGDGGGDDDGPPAAKRQRSASLTSLTVLARVPAGETEVDVQADGKTDRGVEVEESDLELDDLVPGVVADLDARGAAAGAGAITTAEGGTQGVCSLARSPGPAHEAAEVMDAHISPLPRSPTPPQQGTKQLQMDEEGAGPQAVHSSHGPVAGTRSSRGGRGAVIRGRGTARRSSQINSAPPSPSPEPTPATVGSAGNPSEAAGPQAGATAPTGSSNNVGPQQKRQRSEINFNLAPKFPTGQATEVAGASAGPGPTSAGSPGVAVAAGVGVTRGIRTAVASIRRAAMGRGASGTSPGAPGRDMSSPSGTGGMQATGTTAGTTGMQSSVMAPTQQQGVLQQQIALLHQAVSQQQQQQLLPTGAAAQGQGQPGAPSTGVGRGSLRGGRRVPGRGRGRGT